MSALAHSQLPPTAWMNGAEIYSARFLCVHAAGGDELDAAEGAGERLHCAQAAVDVRREELHDLQAVGHRGHDLGRRDAARGDGDVVLHAPAHDLLAVARGDDELCAAGDGLLALLERDDRARAHEHVGAFLGRLPRMESAAAAVRNVISITSTPPASSALAVGTASTASSSTTTGTTAAL